MNFNYGDQTLWLIYITIGSLDSKTWCCQTRLSILFLGSLFIIYKQLEDRENKYTDLKVKIYQLALKTML